jgi:hypothetical protein
MNLTKIAFTSIATILVFAGVTFAGEYQATSKAGEFDVALTIDKNPPVVGNNNVTIAIKDGTGQPVTDAAVRLEFGMAAMPGMPAMNYKADAVLSDGLYKAPMTLSMAGPWFLNAKILRAKKIETAKFNVDVQ